MKVYVFGFVIVMIVATAAMFGTLAIAEHIDRANDPQWTAY